MPLTERTLSFSLENALGFTFKMDVLFVFDSKPFIASYSEQHIECKDVFTRIYGKCLLFIDAQIERERDGNACLKRMADDGCLASLNVDSLVICICGNKRIQRDMICPLFLWLIVLAILPRNECDGFLFTKLLLEGLETGDTTFLCLIPLSLTLIVSFCLDLTEID